MMAVTGLATTASLIYLERATPLFVVLIGGICAFHSHPLKFLQDFGKCFPIDPTMKFPSS